MLQYENVLYNGELPHRGFFSWPVMAGAPHKLQHQPTAFHQTTFEAQSIAKSWRYLKWLSWSSFEGHYFLLTHATLLMLTINNNQPTSFKLARFEQAPNYSSYSVEWRQYQPLSSSFVGMLSCCKMYTLCFTDWPAQSKTLDKQQTLQLRVMVIVVVTVGVMVMRMMMIIMMTRISMMMTWMIMNRVRI